MQHEGRLCSAVQAAFSLGVWLASWAWISAVFLGCLPLLPFVPLRRFQRGLQHALGGVLRLTGSSVDVRYDPRFDASRPAVFCQNHVSLLDAFVACRAIPQPFAGVMHAWHFRIPVYGWLMRLAGSIPLPGGSARERLRTLRREAVRRHETGLSWLVFPEGRRSETGEVQRFRRGALFMARDLGLPVVPVAMRGMSAINHKGSWRFRPGRLEVYVGPQIETRGLADAELRALATVLERQVAAFVASGHAQIPTDAALEPALPAAST